MSRVDAKVALATGLNAYLSTSSTLLNCGVYWKEPPNSALVPFCIFNFSLNKPTHGLGGLIYRRISLSVKGVAGMVGGVSAQEGAAAISDAAYQLLDGDGAMWATAAAAINRFLSGADALPFAAPVGFTTPAGWALQTVIEDPDASFDDYDDAIGGLVRWHSGHKYRVGMNPV